MERDPIEKGIRMIHIAQDGSGDFAEIQEALDFLTQNGARDGGPCCETVLFIHNGIYKERVTVSVPYITFLGESREKTVLTYDLYAQMKAPDIGKLGTFRTYSCMIDTHDFTARNMTFANSAGPGVKVGQALAMYVDGDRIQFDSCSFLGNQDTLFTAPLPPKEIEPNGFIGPKQYAPRINGRQYYKNCYIEGDIDFIFGGATAYFECCEFFSKDTGSPVNSYVTAASTPEGQTYGYVMEGCRFTGNCPPHTAYLGRPWREFARTVLLNCQMGAHICPEGWHDWDKPKAHVTAFYGEYNSTGPGASMDSRPSWVKRIPEEELPYYTKEAVLSGNDGWNP